METTRGSLSISFIIFVLFTSVELTSFYSSDAEYKVLALMLFHSRNIMLIFSWPKRSGNN